MQPVEPIMSGEGMRRVDFGKGQPQYNVLPALVLDTPEGHVISRWQLSEDERRAILDGACIQLSQMTFGGAIQPVHLSVEGVDQPLGIVRLDEQEGS